MSSPKKGPFRIRTIADGEVSMSKVYIVGGMFAAGEVSGLMAPPATGKSVIATDLAASIATGKDWFGRKVNVGAAVYIASERSNVTLRRLRAFALHHNAVRLDVGVISDRIDLLKNEEDAERAVAAVLAYEKQIERQVRWLTIDTVRAAMPGGDENSPRDMGNFARHVALIRDALPCLHVQVLHHTPKGRSTELSGHTSLGAMVDLVIAVSAIKGGRKVLKFIEANDLPALPSPETFDLLSVEIGKDSGGNPLTAPVVRPVDHAVALPATKSTALPPDARTALSVLESLNRGREPIDQRQWKNATLDAFGNRKPGAQRQAFSAARKILIESGAICLNGEFVSVRTPSE